MPSDLNVGLKCSNEGSNKGMNKQSKSQIAASIQVLQKILRLTGSVLSRMPFTSNDCKIKYIGSKPPTTGNHNSAGTPDWPSLISPSMVSVFVGRRLTMTLLPPAIVSKGKRGIDSANSVTMKDRSFTSFQTFHTHTLAS